MKLVNVEVDKTLEELEGENWGEPTLPSYVVTTCHRMRRKPLRELSTEELRVALGQRMGIRFLLPLALNQLQLDPLAQGDFYQGDLLKNVLTAATSAGLGEDRLRDLDAVVERFMDAARRLDETWRETCLPGIAEAVEHYRAHRKK